MRTATNHTTMNESSGDLIRILHVDDSPSFLDLTKDFLEKQNELFEIVSAKSAKEGLNKLESDTSFDLVISDYNMPKRNGLEFLDVLRTNGNKIPFILFTGRGSEEVASDAISRGVTDYIQKDGVGSDKYLLLANRIEQAVDRHRYGERIDRAFAAMETVNDGISIVGDDGRYLYINESAAKMCGESKSDLIGQPWTEYYPDDVIETLYESEVRPSLEETGEWRGISEIEDGDGERIPIDISISKQDNNVSVCVFRDLTKQQKREHQLSQSESALRRMHQITSNQNSSLTQKVNQILELGCESLEISTGTLSKLVGEDTYRILSHHSSFQEISPGDQMPLSQTVCKKPLATGELLSFHNIYDTEWKDTPACQQYGLEAYIGTNVHINGEVFGTLVFSDLEKRQEPFTELEKNLVDVMAQWIEYELNRYLASEELQQQNNRLEKFTSVVSHDLRNPLSVAKGWFDLAVDGDNEKAVDNVQNSLERIEMLIDDLTVLSTQLKNVDSPDEVNLASVAETAWENTDTKDATLNIRDTWMFIGKSTWASQLFENLFRNAVEHGGSDVEVTVGLFQDGFFVEDNGSGIPDGDYETVFKQGYTTKTGNTGAGLDIVNSLAETNGWSVKAIEGPDGGVRFEFIREEHTPIEDALID